MGYGTMVILMGMSTKVIVYTILFKKAPELVPAVFVGIKTYRMKRITGECRFMAKWNNNIILLYFFKNLFNHPVSTVCSPFR